MPIYRALRSLKLLLATQRLPSQVHAALQQCGRRRPVLRRLQWRGALAAPSKRMLRRAGCTCFAGMSHELFPLSFGRIRRKY